MFVAGSLVWGVGVDGCRPDRCDVLGALVCPAGMAVIMYSSGGCRGRAASRVVPVDGAFFTELAAYLRTERPPGCRTAECFVVLRGPTTGAVLTEAWLRRIFRSHRATAGTPRVRPHRLCHTYGTQLEMSGIAFDASFGGLGATGFSRAGGCSSV